MSKRDDYDVMIVGGGLAGATLGCALKALPLRIGIVEARRYGSPSQPSFDDRSIALAYGSRCILQGMGVWEQVVEDACAIKRIHVSNRGRFGFARLAARDYGVEALGYVVESRALGQQLAQVLQHAENVDLLMPASVENIAYNAKSVDVTLDEQGRERQLTAKLLVAADGERSLIREILNLPVNNTAYDHVALIANVTTSKPHDNVAYERFTDAGPLALLPLVRDRCSLVWTMDADAAQALLQQSEEVFLARLQQRFGDRLGKFLRVGSRHIYPLSLVWATRCIAERVALVGNAAHTLHPVAGQGFNLGMRDIAVLAQVISDALAGQCDIGGMQTLERYEQWRRGDHRNVVTFTDMLARLFTNPFPPVVVARNMGLCAMDIFPAAKRVFARRTMGLTGKLPRLARGLTLD